MKNFLIPIVALMLFGLSGHAQPPSTDSTTIASNDSLPLRVDLEGLTVAAQRPLVRQDIDRIGYDVQADGDSRTQSTLDMLRKVPMVTIDGEENILVRGSADFKIYKNGHLDPAMSKNTKDILKTLPASSVKRIEVITDPGAHEDAEGVNAILNIVMMDTHKMEGITGTLNGSYTSKKTPRLGAYLATQFGKAIVSVDYGYLKMSKEETANDGYLERNYFNSGNRMMVDTHGKNPGDLHYANIDASLDIDSLNLISASFGGYFFNVDVQCDAATVMNNRAGELLYSYKEHYWLPSYSHHSWNGRLDYQHKMHCLGEQFTLSYMLAFTRQHSDQETTYSEALNVPFSYSGNMLKKKERFTEHTFQADYVRPLRNGHKLEVGAKFIDRRNRSHNTQDFYIEPALPSFDTQFEHTTLIGAVYLDYMYNAGRWSARGGLRYEHSFLQGNYPDGKDDDFSRHLNDWVPQASLKYQLTESQSLKLNYTTSINRPGISYLNPAVVTSPSVVQQGNPLLVSSVSQSIALVYMYVGRRLTLQLAPSYRFSNGGIASVQTAKDDVRYLTYDNIQRYRRFGFEQYVQWRPFDGTTLVVNNNLRYEHYENPNLSYRTFGWSDNYYANLTQQLPWKFRLYLMAYGKIGHSPTSVYFMQHSYYGYYASLQRSFLKNDRLTLRIGANNPFDKYITSKAESVNGDYRDFQESWNRGRSFSLSLTWRFGSLKASVKKTEHSIENDDVVGGITKGQ